MKTSLALLAALALTGCASSSEGRVPPRFIVQFCKDYPENIHCTHGPFSAGDIPPAKDLYNYPERPGDPKPESEKPIRIPGFGPKGFTP